MNAKMSRIKWMRAVGNFSYILGAAFLIASLAINALPAGPALARNNNNGNTGAIWTTSGSCGAPQNVNHYQSGNVIYINGSGFDAGDYDWHIKGQPGGASGDPGDVVASDTVTVGAGGAFCFAAYTVHGDDWGEYSVKVGTKGDNYNVTAPTAAPTDAPVDPTSTPADEVTATPADDVTATPTNEVTATPTDEVTATPTDVVTSTPTDVPQEPTPTPTEVTTQIPGEPTTTPTPHPTQKPLSLNVSSFCGPNSDQLNWWKIVNKDSSDAAIIWKVMPSGSPSDNYLLPGDSNYKFSTPKDSGDDKLYVYDGLENLVTSVSAASDCKQDQATPTAVPANPNPAPSTSQAEVLIPVTGADLNGGSGMRVMFLNLGIGFLGLGLVLNGGARQRKSWDL